MSASTYDELVVWGGVLAGLIAVLAIVAYVAARWLKHALRADTAVEPFTIQNLRELRDCGAITAEEYEKMRAALLGRRSAKAAPPQLPEPTPASPLPPGAPSSGPTPPLPTPPRPSPPDPTAPSPPPSDPIPPSPAPPNPIPPGTPPASP